MNETCNFIFFSREFANATDEQRKWIVMDGPVDPGWIENLNTALDDSKKLCLMNGEIIHMTNWMTVFFETDLLGTVHVLQQGF